MTYFLLLTRWLFFIWVSQVVPKNWNDSIFGYIGSGFRKNVLSLITIMLITLLLHIKFQRGGVLKSDKICGSLNKNLIYI